MPAALLERVRVAAGFRKPVQLTVDEQHRAAMRTGPAVLVLRAVFHDSAQRPRRRIHRIGEKGSAEESQEHRSEEDAPLAHSPILRRPVLDALEIKRQQFQIDPQVDVLELHVAVGSELHRRKVEDGVEPRGDE